MQEESRLEKIVSFCIPTYNRCEVVLRLIKSILQSSNQRFEIVVVDNCSDDDTIEKLRCIHDDRLKVFSNNRNLGAKLNWYHALENGEGKYLFQLLDRDLIKLSEIDRLVDVLEKNDFMYGYCGSILVTTYKKQRDSKDLTLYRRGEEGLLKFALVPNHPTGVIFNRESWKRIRIRESIFTKECYGDYPHGYISAIMAEKGDGAILHFDICNIRRTPSEKKFVSHFYNNTGKYYWLPKTHFHDLRIITDYIWKMHVENDLKEKLLLQRFRERLFSATIAYASTVENSDIMQHYLLETKRVAMLELMCINYSFCKAFYHITVPHYEKSGEWKKSIFEIGQMNFKKIVELY